MTMRIGIGVSPDSVCAIMVRGREVEWSSIDIVDDDGLDAALARVLSKLPRVSWPRPRVHAGVGADHAYIKTIHGLPLIHDPRALARIVAASPGRFFVVAPGTATVTGVRVLEDGVARVAIVKNDAINAIQDLCTERGFTLARIVPGEIALSSLADEERLDPCALALGATLLDRREAIVMRPKRWVVADRKVGRPRLALAATVAGIAVLAALTFPTFVAKGNAAVARREVASLAPARARALSAERNLTAAARMLSAVSKFERGRTSMTWLLEQLVNALPTNAEIVSLKADSTAVTLSAIATTATDVVRSVQDMPGASKVEMIGAITYESADAGVNAGVDRVMTATGLERVTIRFRLAPDPADIRTPFVSEPGERK